MDSLTYFAIILGIGIVSMVAALFVVLRGWSQSRGGVPSRASSQALTVSAARVHAIWPGSGKPIVWVVGGKSYSHPADVGDPQHRAALDEFFGMVQAFVPAAVAVSASTPPANTITQPSAPDFSARFGALPTSTQATNTPTVSPNSSYSTPEISEPKSLAVAPPPPPVRRTYEEELELPLLERLKSSFFSGRSDSGSVMETLDRLERAPSPVMPKIEELDELLQLRLATLHHPPQASIRAGASGLLHIVVAGQSYEHIDDVPYDDVRAAMREAVQLWERRLV